MEKNNKKADIAVTVKDLNIYYKDIKKFSIDRKSVV